MTPRKSRPRSATTSKPHKRRRDPAFHFPPIYVDESASQLTLPTELRNRGLKVYTRHDVFAANEPIDDPTWLSHCGRHKWIAITKDKGIRHRPAEIQMLLAARVRMFVISAGGLTGRDQAELIVKALGAMRRWVLNEPAPFAVRIMPGAKTELIASGRHAPPELRRRRRRE